MAMAFHPPIGVLGPVLRDTRAPLADELAVERVEPLGELLRRTLAEVVDLYPEPLRSAERADLARQLFHLEQIYRPGAALADLGGGIGLLSPACAALGMRSWLVDDLRDGVNQRFPIDALGVHRRAGVRVLATPVLGWGEHFEDASLDVVTCIDSIEHWHHSPRPVLEEVARVLRPGGLLLLGVPNAANARHRLALLLGTSNWSRFEDWYYPSEFRGHVREPVLADLVRIVDELGFERTAVFGRNWLGAPRGWKRLAIAAADRALRPFPTLCKDLYVLATKPAA
jgi:SAM-dependent methyltransferase